MLLLLRNAFFVGAEFAAMAARRSTLEPLADGGSPPRARSCLDAMEHVGSMLACAQLGITVCSVGLGALAEAALHHIARCRLLEACRGSARRWPTAIALVVALRIVVYLHVVVGEMIPKNLAIAGPDRAALMLVPALLFVSRALRPAHPASWSAVAKSLVRLLRRRAQGRDHVGVHGGGGRSTSSAESRREGLIEADQQGLVGAALEFSDKDAIDVAVPLGPAGDRGAGRDARGRRAARGQARVLPVTRVVDARRCAHGLPAPQGRPVCRDAERDLPVPVKRVRQLATVQPADEVEEVLATMQRTGAHLARVVDGEGQDMGVVFLEDVLEELVGEVTDASQR